MNKIVMIAMVCHEANKAWCEDNGDNTQAHWHDAEGWQRESAIKGVQFRIDNPIAGEDAQHNAWMKDKLDSGWVYGEIKDPVAKTHPCLVPFNQLPEFQQKKDKLFCAVVDALKDKSTELAPGEKLVGLQFNPSGDAKVNRAKALCAELADLMFLDELDGPASYLYNLIKGKALGEILGAQMMAVKLLTLKY